MRRTDDGLGEALQQRGRQPHVLPRRQHADQHVAQPPAAVQQLRHHPPCRDRLLWDVHLGTSRAVAHISFSFTTFVQTAEGMVK